MKKTIFEELCKAWGLPYLLSYLARGRRTEIYRRMRTKAFAVSEEVPQMRICESAYKW